MAAQTGFVGDIAASVGIGGASAAYSGAPITLGAPTFNAPGGVSNMVRDVLIGVLVAVLAGMVMKKMKVG